MPDPDLIDRFNAAMKNMPEEERERRILMRAQAARKEPKSQPAPEGPPPEVIALDGASREGLVAVLANQGDAERRLEAARERVKAVVRCLAERHGPKDVNPDLCNLEVVDLARGLVRVVVNGVAP